MKVAFIYGTRPEIIKLSPLIKKCKDKMDVCTIFTGQHSTLYEDVKDLVPDPDYYVRIPLRSSLNKISSILFEELEGILVREKPDVVIVQGDTTSSFCGAVVAFNIDIEVGHVEAGLRTYDIKSPYPEEFNRQVISKIATYNWCPTQEDLINLDKEGVSGSMMVTGNTIVDFVNSKKDLFENKEGNKVIITLHRRENKNKFEKILKQINYFAKKQPNLKFIFPAHPNPNIQNELKILTEKNIEIVKPMPYLDFLRLLSESLFVISDSGGIQEECACLKKKILVCRDTTERNSIIEIGLGLLVDDNLEPHFEWAIESFNGEFSNPYGNGNASDLIIESLLNS